MITRDVRGAEERRFDLIVVGGGVYGCMLALEAARHGLKPLLLERDDFAQHTSANWLRIVHGGLRYLQSFDLRRHVESVRSRRWFLASFPELIEPLSCLMPLYGHGLRRSSVMAVALAANDLLSAARNRGVRPDRRISRGRVLPPSAVAHLAPSVEAQGLKGGALWYDAVARQPERLIVAILQWAASEGAVLANYVEVVGLTQRDGIVTGVKALDRWADRFLEFRAPVVVNCGGPWAAGLARQFDTEVPHLFRPSVAVNVLFERQADFEGALAVAADRADARTYYLLNARDSVLAGTYHAPLKDQSSPTPTDKELTESFSRELDEAIPGLGLGSSKVLRVFRGLLPVRRQGTVDLASREVVHDHGANGGPRGLFSVSGVKFTVARHVALRTIAVIERGGGRRSRTPSSNRPPPLHPVPTAAEILALEERTPGAGCALIERIIEQEAVQQPEDLLLRRTDWGVYADRALGELVEQAFRASEESAGT